MEKTKKMMNQSNRNLIKKKRKVKKRMKVVNKRKRKLRTKLHQKKKIKQRKPKRKKIRNPHHQVVDRVKVRRLNLLLRTLRKSKHL